MNLPARRFREGNFEDFYGDPFDSIEEIFNESAPHTAADSPPLQKFQVNTGSAESISQESQASHTHSSGMENEEPEIVEQHDYYRLESPNQIPNQANPPNSVPQSQFQDQDISSHDLSQTSSVAESESEKSSPQSSGSGRRMRKSNKSSVESLQDVVVTEREEPVLQVSIKWEAIK